MINWSANFLRNNGSSECTFAREPQSSSHAFAAAVMDTHIEPASMAVMLQTCVRRRSVQISRDFSQSLQQVLE
jgi:hypothetical protein